jgi:hypothetical protein
VSDQEVAERLKERLKQGEPCLARRIVAHLAYWQSVYGSIKSEQDRSAGWNSRADLISATESDPFKDILRATGVNSNTVHEDFSDGSVAARFVEAFHNDNEIEGHDVAVLRAVLGGSITELPPAAREWVVAVRFQSVNQQVSALSDQDKDMIAAITLELKRIEILINQKEWLSAIEAIASAEAHMTQCSL